MTFQVENRTDRPSLKSTACSDSPAGLFDEGDRDQDSLPEEDEQQNDDDLHGSQDDHCKDGERSTLTGCVSTSLRSQNDRVFVLTEGQPGLSDLQVHREVRLQAQVADGDISTGLPLQAGELHVTVENT